jgi:hypothetical protein
MVAVTKMACRGNASRASSIFVSRSVCHQVTAFFQPFLRSSSCRCFAKSKSSHAMLWTTVPRKSLSNFTNVYAPGGIRSRALIRPNLPFLSCPISIFWMILLSLGSLKCAVSNWFVTASIYPCILTTNDQSSSLRICDSGLGRPNASFVHASNSTGFAVGKLSRRAVTSFTSSCARASSSFTFGALRFSISLILLFSFHHFRFRNGENMSHCAPETLRRLFQFCGRHCFHGSSAITVFNSREVNDAIQPQGPQQYGIALVMEEADPRHFAQYTAS